MYKFSDISKERLVTCHKDLQILFNEVILYYDCTIVCGNRSQKDQDKAFNDGYSQLRYPFSKHNSFPSQAVDVVPYPIDWKDTKRMYHFIGFVTAIKEYLLTNGNIRHNIKNGADWDCDNDFSDQKFNDLPHWEIIV